MKILWHSNAPWSPTGYGNQTGLFTPRLNVAGYDVAVSAFYGLHGSILSWNGLPVMPGGAHAYGVDMLPQHAAAWFKGDPGLIVTLVDVWVLDGPGHQRLPVCCWTPIDHSPPPPRVLDYLRVSGSVPIAMSRHGERELQAAGLDPVYVPHGVDTTVFQPGDRDEARARLSLPVPDGCFLVGMVAANKGWPARKSWPRALEAFRRFREHRSDAVLYLHTELGSLYGGPNLLEICAALDVPAGSVFACDQYRNLIGGHDPAHMADLYRAFDVLLNPAMGEGFGIPVLEAQACGTPVIVTDSTAMTEVGAVGWQVGGERWWSEQGSWQVLPDVGQITAALDDAYLRASRLRDRAREHALAYDADLVTREFWLPALERCADRKLHVAAPEDVISVPPAGPDPVPVEEAAA